MDRRLGEPLPHQQANPTQAPPAAGASKERPPLTPPQDEAGYHAVLARVSPSCPPLLGRFLRVTHPSATVLTPEGAFSFDLHVLGLPPTFNLSHDQTLQFDFPVQRVAQNGSRLLNEFSCYPHEWLDLQPDGRARPKASPAAPTAAYMVNFFGLKEQDRGLPPRSGLRIIRLRLALARQIFTFFAGG